MSSIRCSAFFSSTLLAASAMAQTLSSPGNIPVVGTSFEVHRAAYAAAPVLGGTDQTFDYSGLTMTGTVNYDCIDPSGYSNAAAFPTAEVAIAVDGDTLFYRDAGGLEKVGERRTYLGMYAVEAPLSNGATELFLPLAYGDAWSDNIAGTITVNGEPASRTGNISGVADATGVLTLPGGATATVLRVKTIVNESTTFNVGVPVTVTHKRTEYGFYAPFLKMPMLRVYGDSLTASLGGLTQNSGAIEWLDDAELGVADHAADAFGMSLYPNPANTAVDISYLTFGSSRLTIEVSDMRGAVVLRKDLGARAASLQRERLDVNALGSGLYTVSLTDAQGARSVKRLGIIR